MPSYSMDFLSRDWDGAGLDMSFAAIFAPQKIHTESIRAFFAALSQYASTTINWAPDAVGVSRSVEAKEIKGFLETTFKWTSADWDSGQRLVADVETKHGFIGHVELTGPDLVEVEAPCENYYKGSTEEDDLLVSDMTEIIEMAAAAFGEGYGAFGAIHVDGRASKLKNSGAVPNVTVPLCKEIKADIICKCTEIRELADQ